MLKNADFLRGSQGKIRSYSKLYSPGREEEMLLQPTVLTVQGGLNEETVQGD